MGGFSSRILTSNKGLKYELIFNFYEKQNTSINFNFFESGTMISWKSQAAEV